MTPIATHALTRSYRRHLALQQVTLSVPQGAVYALVGPNGAGKTTLIQLLMNLQPASSGTAEILGRSSLELRGAALQQIGYISETQEMPETMTVGSYLAYLRRFYPGWDAALENQLLREFSLPLDRKLKHLSRGMRMKAAFVSALSYRPALLILDEPFSGLDPLVRDELIQGLLDRIGESTLFLSSHDLTEIEGFASHVGYLEEGKLLFSDEMNVLSSRFRQIEFQVTSRTLPATLPAAWLEVEQAGSLVRFTDSAFTSIADSHSQIAAIFPTARELSVEPLSLRSIFLANARTNRNLRAQSTPGAQA